MKLKLHSKKNEEKVKCVPCYEPSILEAARCMVSDAKLTEFVNITDGLHSPATVPNDPHDNSNFFFLRIYDAFQGQSRGKIINVDEIKKYIP